MAKKKKRKNMKIGKISDTVSIHEHNSNTEVMISHKDEKLRILCDDDGIHIG